MQGLTLASASDIMRTLLVYYSRTGHTRALAQRLATLLDAELDEIVERTDRHGAMGYLRSGNEATFHLRAPILPSEKDLRSFDLVVSVLPFGECRSRAPCALT